MMRTFCQPKTVFVSFVGLLDLTNQFKYPQIGDWIIKTALINIFILTVVQITICNVKGDSHSDQPTDDYLDKYSTCCSLHLWGAF